MSRRSSGLLAATVGLGAGSLLIAAAALVAAEPPSSAEQAPPTPFVSTTPETVPEADPGDGPVDAQWLRATAEAAGVPERALSAYVAAAARSAREQPDCGLGWNTLAAIGEIESAHGGTLDAEGRADPPVIGPRLDGGGSFAAVPDTDDGALDGHRVWDRAVGPMQFLPGTWAAYGAEPGHGAGDPQRIDDAARAAARYLCDEGRVLTRPDDLAAALLAYNRDHRYVVDVATAADRIGTALTAPPRQPSS